MTRLPEHLPNTLTELYCSNNRLTRLPEQLPNSLINLSCYNNYLTRLPEHLPDSLDCEGNPFLFNCKNNLQIFTKTCEARPKGSLCEFSKNTSFNNYKVLVVLQCKQKITIKSTYFYRDLSRLCNIY